MADSTPRTYPSPAPPPSLPLPDLSPDDPLVRLASHYGAALDRYIAVNGQCEAIADARHAFDCGPVDAADREHKAADRALMLAMSDRDTPMLAAAGKLFISTCFDRDLPEPPVYVLAFDLADLPRSAPAPEPVEDPSPLWYFSADDLTCSEGSDDENPFAVLTVEFQLRGEQAAAVRAWLARNTQSINDD